MAQDTVNGEALSEALVAKRLGQGVLRCYQCGECTAGCPMAPDMDVPPSQVIRLVQIGEAEDALRSSSIWFCASCQTCTTRCPQGFEIAKFMDLLRELSLKRDLVHPRAKPLVAFHKSFLDTVKLAGRAHEMGLITLYKMRTGRFLDDLLLVPGMLKRRKIHLKPERVKDVQGWKSLIKAVLEESAKDK